MSRKEFLVPDERLLPVFDAAGHVDEGTVHTWLDEAFDAESAAQVAQHVSACDRCAELAAEARGLKAASTRVLSSLDTVPSAIPGSVVASVNTARRASGIRPQWWWRAAAAVVVVIGGTVLLRESGGNSEPAEARTAEAGTTGVAATGVGTTGMPTATVPAAPSPAAAPPVGQPPVVPPPAVPRLTASPAEPPATAARLAAADVAPALPVRVTVSGTVRDAGTQQPLANVGVWLRTADGTVRQAVSNSLGGYSLPAFDAARGTSIAVQARMIGFQPSTNTLVVTAPNATVDFALRAAVLALNEVVTTAPAPINQKVTVSSMVAMAPAAPQPERRLLARESVRDASVAVAGGVTRGMAPPLDREQYDRIEDNPFIGVRQNPLSTFSIDVDRASYGNVRRFLTAGQRPPKDAVRIEELINYFPYDLAEPRDNAPVAVSSETMPAPWQPQHRLVRIALQARRIETADLPPNNLVFLVDVSGSMNEWNKLPLVKQALRLLVHELRPQDRVAIVAYAGAAGLVLPSTSGDEKTRIMEAIDRLEAGGSTAGGAGIELAYRTAREHFLTRGNNRVILTTDGDFNVGVSSDAELERLVELRRRDGTYLTVLGFGTGNFQAAKMEKLAKVGNGNFAYVDTPFEARKVLVVEMGATLLTVANDVKLQVEFNPSRVVAYRLIGYENRLLAAEDFNDDTKDAGDIGTGHQVTALYEVVPVGVTGTVPVRGVDSLRYLKPEGDNIAARSGSDELLFVKLRYKRPGNSGSELLTHAVSSRMARRASSDLRFTAAVAGFGMLLRDSEYKGNNSAAQVLEQARAALGEDRGGYRAEFVSLVERWRALGVTAGERR